MLWSYLLRSHGDDMTTVFQNEEGLRAQLELARMVQLSLLPERRCCVAGWELSFYYEPAGYVSGDYVDIIPAGPEAFYFALGDVSGRGIAASMLMSHLHATLRTLLPLNWQITEVVKNASHTFCQNTLPAQFATLVLGRADSDGNIELVNAGHTPVLIAGKTEVQVVPATSLPLGMFCATDFTSTKRTLAEESMLLLYSDGIAESTDEAGAEYGFQRMVDALAPSRRQSPSDILEIIHQQILTHVGGAQPGDDRTMLALRWLPKSGRKGPNLSIMQ